MDFDRLLKLRLVVARFGEMDRAQWWNTRGQLGRLGESALRRGFPRTHFFARARSVFSVAAHRCKEVFDPPQCATLWNLPAAVEDEFDSQWERWLEDEAGQWAGFGQVVEATKGEDLTVIMQEIGLVGPGDIAAVAAMRRSAQGRSVLLPGTFAEDAAVLMTLALAFSKGDKGQLVVPYIKLDN